ncbi:MAG: 4'-phosphopantetheinyl transferase superfamily protein [Rubrivivax sp.]|nr:MAG: 4'-phosphopantetheinyl transferase superfamily protein [Rubrivivax sp.]
MVHVAGEYERLNDNQIHLWLTRFDDPSLDRLLAEYRKLLTADELAQEKRFHFEKDRRRYLVTRTLLRCTLSRYLDIAPSAWKFATNEHGRPHIANPDGPASRIHFNISHTNSLIALAVSAQGPVGVDTENASRRVSLTLADHYFAETEKVDVQSLPPSEQPFRFFEYWTLKEAYIKARGMGLSIPLDQFSFDVSRPGRVALSLDPRLEDDAARWSLWQWCLDDGYLLALCAQRGGEIIPSVQLWRTLPLLLEQPENIKPSRSSRHGPD